MQNALIALDSLPGAPVLWTFGGGTALAQLLDHRISYDVDIFLDSSAALKNLAPNINPVTKSLCDTWNWPGKYLKLILRDVGEIDFLTAPSYIDHPTYALRFGDRVIRAERSAEIATKKLKYRASRFAPRDAYDLAAIYLHDHDALREVAQCPAISEAVIAAARDRLNHAKHDYQAEMRKVINPTARGEEFIDRSCEIALDALAELKTLVPKDDNAPDNRLR
ncbi:MULTISPECIES: nucleotidyl transferase AbiEii/AbiGii toxin family protein [Rhodopseudomonas]|uniref:nucleotidyl transferase AbiEii/AbiGii toxin family protein n=1 Tax=Rhodopseudomonas TaxID=1073 RepID=UPI000696052C|nr:MULTISPECIES: nucleotidyl transferase AbiEii/AbiGii toxin family protein [Rhodopseudomonas]MDF3809052.1 nucleotidyl transferase AbiEii/AbiGii toxin family protein [Rhodopseudomonas sp. BAL398]WOK18977.1 nucleotidyl transferase AbiEii/AbiGii toxin family protein [Rhodopseudomonas sp. BAL398]